MNGRTIPIDRVERIKISASETDSAPLIAQVKRDDERSSAIVIGGPSDEWQAAARAKDVTAQFITGPPGVRSLTAQSVPSVAAAPNDSATVGGTVDRLSVFVVAGRDAEINGCVAAFLRALGLRVVEWDHAVERTGMPNPYIGDVVTAGLNMANAALVVLTPDDNVRLREDLQRDDDASAEHVLSGQARPNVFYDAGYADALGRERTVIIAVGTVKDFSDVLGRHVVRYDGGAVMRNTLAGRLKVAGLSPDTTGSDWLTAGDLESVLKRRIAAGSAVET